MSEKVHYLLHGIQDRYNALYQENMERLGERDIAVASIGGSGQSLLGNILLEAGLNYVDPYIEEIGSDGTCRPARAYADYASRLSATSDREAAGRTAGRWPRFFKTHLTPEFLSARPLLGVWLLVRDPRDALYSWYKFRTDFAKDPLDIGAGTFSSWLEQPGPTGAGRLHDWTDFYDRWHRVAGTFQRTTVTGFEELKSRPVATLRKNMDDLGLVISDEALERAVERSSFAAMRAHEDKHPDNEADQPMVRTRIMRSGTPQEWHRWITPALARQFQQEPMPLVASHFGYDVK